MRWAALLLSCRPPERAPDDPEGSGRACDQVDWTTSAEPFLRTWCTSCHSAGLAAEERSGAPLGLDFDTYDSAYRYREAIASAALGDDPRMPPVGDPPVADRDQLAAWLACGAPGDARPSPRCVNGDFTRVTTFEPGCASGLLWLEGDLLVSEDLDAPCLCGIDGRLTLVGGSVALPELVEVGELQVSGGQRLELPRLARAGSIQVASPELTWLDLRELLEVDELVIQDNPALVEVDLSRIETVRGDLRLEDNLVLETVYGELYGLRQLDGGLVLRGNPRWAGFYGVALLPEIPGDLVVSAQASFQILNGFTGLQRVGGSVEISHHPALRFLEGFDQLREIGGDLRLLANPLLEAEDAFAQLEVVGGALSVRDLPQLGRLSGVSRARSANRVEVIDCPALVVLEWPSLAEAPAGLTLQGLPGLRRLDGIPATTLGTVALIDLGISTVAAFTQLQQVQGDLRVERCSGLDTWPGGLAGLREVDGQLVVQGVPALSRDALEAWAEGLVVGGEVLLDP